MSPTSLTTSTTQRLLQRSSRINLATRIRSPRTCVTWNSTMRPSEKRYLHHYSFKRTGDKLITLMCKQNQVAKKKTKESGFSLRDKKSKFSLRSEPRFRNTNSRPILTEEVSWNKLELSSLSEEKLIILLQVMNNFDEITNFFMNNYQNKIGFFVKLVSRICETWKKYRKFTC